MKNNKFCKIFFFLGGGGGIRCIMGDVQVVNTACVSYRC